METKRLIVQLSPETMQFVIENSTPHTRSAFLEKVLSAYQRGQSERGVLERIAEAMEKKHPGTMG